MMAGSGTWEPRYLGKAVGGPIDEIEMIPWEGGSVLVTLDCAEFTTLCPVTGQPDFGRLVIEYIPDRHLIETKSLKLYLQGYRDRKGFNEQIVVLLAEDIFRRLKPKWIKVTGRYNRRGGIAIQCETQRGSRPEKED